MSNAAPRRRFWIWPFAVPEPVGRSLLFHFQRLATTLSPLPFWIILGLMIGVLSRLFPGIVGWTATAAVKSVALAILVTAAASRDWQGRALLVMGVCFASHSAVTVGLTLWSPETTAAVFPDGDAYWQKSYRWIVTGENPEYALSHWLPVHLILAVVMVGAGYASLGWIPFFRGFHQLDLMNVYVGRLLTVSTSPAAALAVGWHPWSLLRGLGFALLLYESVSLSLERLTGERLSTSERRRARWLGGLFLLVLDGIVKYLCLDAVRTLLANQVA